MLCFLVRDISNRNDIWLIGYREPQGRTDRRTSQPHYALQRRMPSNRTNLFATQSIPLFVTWFQRSRRDSSIKNDWLTDRHTYTDWQGLMSAAWPVPGQSQACRACLSVSHWCPYPFYSYETRIQALVNSPHMNFWVIWHDATSLTPSVTANIPK